jgi:hypothetical protein
MRYFLISYCYTSKGKNNVGDLAIGNKSFPSRWPLIEDLEKRHDCVIDTFCITNIFEFRNEVDFVNFHGSLEEI